MGGERTSRYLVLSDLHFGTGRSSVNDESVVQALVCFIAQHRPWTEVVFTGDLLDLDAAAVLLGTPPEQVRTMLADGLLVAEDPAGPTFRAAAVRAVRLAGG